MIAPGVRRATLALGATAQSLAVDETLGPWRVQRIEAGRVRLSGPGGTLDLGLATSTAEAPAGTAWNNPCGRLHPRPRGTRAHDVAACRTALDQTGLR